MTRQMSTREKHSRSGFEPRSRRRSQRHRSAGQATRANYVNAKALFEKAVTRTRSPKTKAQSARAARNLADMPPPSRKQPNPGAASSVTRANAPAAASHARGPSASASRELRGDTSGRGGPVSASSGTSADSGSSRSRTSQSERGSEHGSESSWCGPTARPDPSSHRRPSHSPPPKPRHPHYPKIPSLLPPSPPQQIHHPPKV